MYLVNKVNKKHNAADISMQNVNTNHVSATIA